MTTPAKEDLQGTERLLWTLIEDDRKKTRRSTYFKYGALTVFAGAYLFVGLQFSKGSATDKMESYAAVVRIDGEIGAGKPASLEALEPQLVRAFEDKNAKGVILAINSPGGTPVQSALIYDRVRALKAEHHKKVVAVGEDMLTSGAYFIATSADDIVVNRSTLAGSIGVISRSFGFTGLMDKLGVERRVMTAGESKNMLDPFGPQTTQDATKQAELLAQIHNHFKDAVKAGRGKRLDPDQPGLFSGSVWTGSVAVQMGLADKLGDKHSAAKEYLGAKELKVFAPTKSFVETIMSGFGLSVAHGLVQAGQEVAMLAPGVQALAFEKN